MSAANAKKTTAMRSTTPRSFVADIRGAAAIEFGFLAPLLMLMLLGTIELGRAISTDRHFTTAISSAGDLVAREQNLGTTDAAAKSNLDGMMLSIKHLMQPYESNTLKLSVYSVKASTTQADKGKVEWVYSYNGASAPAKCSDYTLPTGLISKGGSVIVVDGTYQFKSLFGSYVPGMNPSMTWQEKSYHSPRNVCVDYVEGKNCISSC
ncbi:MAG: TadE/TadG family type IV pilus assembly protein [Hyphomicrobium sp.]|jgi:Flp pilus assembly protein TadG